jgi:hypothetical protein
MANNPHVAVPWGAISKSPSLYLYAKYQPVTSEIKEPSKMTGLQARSLFNFWKKRQLAGQEPFRFRKVDETHVRESSGRKRIPHLAGTSRAEDGESSDWEHLLVPDDDDSDNDNDDENPDLTWR